MFHIILIIDINSTFQFDIFQTEIFTIFLTFTLFFVRSNVFVYLIVQDNIKLMVDIDATWLCNS